MPALLELLLKTCATPEPMSLKVVTNVYPVTLTNTLQTELPIVPNVLLPTAKAVSLVTLANAQVSPPAVAIISTVIPLEPMPAPPLQVALPTPALPSDVPNAQVVTI